MNYIAMDIEYLPHTADIRMKIQGSSLEELFLTGILGMNGILHPGFCSEGRTYEHRSRIQIKSLGSTNLLIDFLSDVLSHTYAENLIYCRIDFLEFSENHLDCWLHGEKIESFDEEIKAVTYHEANIVKNSNGDWETIIVFDI